MTSTVAADVRTGSLLRTIGIVIVVAGIVLAVAGVVTWFTVQSQLADENIVVSDDAEAFAGEPVDGPLTAYAEAQVIKEHALDATGGLTYAEIPRDDPVRATAMNASFLRASLFTSVVAFGVAALSVGLGIVLVLIGYALLRIAPGFDGGSGETVVQESQPA